MGKGHLESLALQSLGRLGWGLLSTLDCLGWEEEG